MAAKPLRLRDVLESIADGDSFEIVTERAGRLTDNDRHLVPHIHLVASLSEVHRSFQVDEDSTEETDVSRELELAPGDRWGNLELKEKVGDGAFGQVWRAQDIHLNADVALKVLHARTNEDALTSRLLKEGRALARLRHPNVVTVHGIETREGHVGLRMEFVRGQTLETLLRSRGTFSATEAASVGLDLCRALAAVHRAGLIHRDVKAQNVMREQGGRIVLMDLGSGQLTSEQAMGGLAGTPLYLAPEVIAGEDASPQSDLYSVGVLLYHLVTGSYPYRAKTLEDLAEQQKTDRAIPIHDDRPDLPEGFARVVERAIARRPEDRFESAGAMAKALSSVEKESEVRAPAPWNWRPLLGAAIVVMLLVTAWAVTRPGIKSGGSLDLIAVLPFSTVGVDNELELLSRGIPMEVTASLGQIGAIKVVPWSFTRRFDRGRSLSAVASQTSADAIIEGTVQRASAIDDAPLKVSVQLYRASTATLLWSQEFQTRTGGVMTLQAEIARRIAGQLKIVLARRERLLLERFKNIPDDAVELYLKGRESFEAYDNAGFAAAINYFGRVLEIDPSFADAHAALAECYVLQAAYSASIPAEQAYARSLAAAGKALEINADLPEAYSARGFARALLGWEWKDAEQDFKRALELDPHSASAHGAYSNYLTMVGRYEEAIDQSRIAEERTPFSPVATRRVAWAYYMARRYHEAIEQLRRVLDMDPTYGPARTLLARAYSMVGWHNDAIREIEPIPREFEAIAAQIYAQAGQLDRARELLAIATLPHNNGNPRYQIAAAYAALGDHEQALLWLDRAFAVHESGLVHLARDPRLDPLRGDPRFDLLVARLYQGTR